MTKLLPGERLRCLARPHWIVLARSLVWSPAPLLAVVVPAVAARALPVPAGLALLVPPALLLGLAAGAGAAGAGHIAWASRFVLVTDRRAAQQSGIPRRRRTMVPLDRIQDVTTARGPLGTLLGYGDINVTTAGLPRPSLVLTRVRAPSRSHEPSSPATQPPIRTERAP